MSNEQNVRSYYMSDYGIRDLLFKLIKVKFGSFYAAILSLIFSPYFCPVLQCNKV